MNIYYTDSNQLNAFFSALKNRYKVFYPIVKNPNYTGKTDYSYTDEPSGEPLVFNSYRCVEPLKSFFTFTRDKAAQYFSQDEPQASTQVVLFGVKSCDIAGHKVQDYVFLEGVEVDSSYRLRRENTIIISSDCTDFKEVCHCLAWEILPYPTEKFDLNLSPLNEGYLLEAGSQKGEILIGEFSKYFVIAKDAQIAARKVKRDNLIDRLRRELIPKHLVTKGVVQRLVREGYSLDTWKQFMLTCVECGGCNFICDTCHCFLLSDKKDGNANDRFKLWDSCLYANYAKVAGGANPNKLRAQRLRFRFIKKFDFFVDNLGMPACCGCGRCIEVCPGRIDIREVLKDLAKKLNINT